MNISTTTANTATFFNTISTSDMVDLLSTNLHLIDDETLASEIQYLIDNYNDEEYINQCKPYSELSLNQLLDKVTTDSAVYTDFIIDSMYWVTVGFIGNQNPIYADMLIEYNNILHHLDNVDSIKSTVGSIEITMESTNV